MSKEKTKIALQCSSCMSISEGKGLAVVPYDEVRQFRSDDDGRFMCWKCCKEQKWESPCCAKCSDRVFCEGKAVQKFEEAMKDVKGV